MVEFGARLSLKDNMSATIRKNIDTQKKFTKQVKETNEHIKKLGKAKAKPTISVKDTALKVIKKTGQALKSVGKMVAKPFVAIKDGATKALDSIKKKLSSLAKTSIKVGVGVAGAGLTALLGGSISEGAKLEQSIGGVQTLYGEKASQTVIDNANKAFRTAGLSANAYMETVTSFSASLLNSLGGDTAKSAKIADMAIIDMADNANKFGTDMESIQNAYQGFAKQNYTMLDNLKLGYSGSQEGMKQLLKDAQKLSGVKYDMSNLADVYEAIHVIQDKKLGISGATKDEAEGTFSGSFSAMKASAQNLLGAMATGGDVEGTMSELISSASTFLFNNAIPMVIRVVKSLPTAIKTGIAQAKPQLMEAGVSLFGDTFSNVVGVIGKVKDVITNIVKATEPIRTTVFNIFEQVIGKISTVIEVVQKHMGTFKAIFDAVIPAVQTVLETAWSVISPIIDLCITIFDELMNCVGVAFPTIQSVIEGVWSVLEGIFGAIADGISLVGDAISGVGEFIGGGINKVGSWLGFAYGKDRVPYDNYPARLHAGEKVLTRNQADQYERIMSTRGVQLSGNPVEVSQGVTSANAGGTTVNIEKLADTVVIEKEADVDKVVEDMINKFRKLVPNMG